MTRPANAVTLWEAITAFEIPIDTGKFIRKPGSRSQGAGKIVKQFWDDACLQFITALKKHTLEDVCRAYKKSVNQPTYQI